MFGERICHQCIYLGSMQLGQVCPAWHGIELWLGSHQILDRFTHKAWQLWSALFKQC